jgi:hypothetical protein
MMMPKEAIDIEELLRHAYQMHQVDRLATGFTPRGPSASPASGFAQYLALGTRVDTSGAAAVLIGREAAASSIPDDLLAVHDAVLALDDFFVETTAGGEVAVWDAETAVAAGQWLEVERGLAWIMPAEIERDPHTRAVRKVRAFAEERRALDRIVTSPLVILNSRAGTRPPLVEARIIKYRPVYAGARKQAVRHDPVFDPPLDTVAFHRAEYAVWWHCLEVLAATLDLETFAVSGPAAEKEPWLNELSKPLPDLRIPAPPTRRARRRAKSAA